MGASWTVAGGGVICTAAALVFRARLPAIRVYARRLVLAQQMEAGLPPQQMVGGNLEMESAPSEPPS